MASPRLFTGKSRPRPGEDDRILPLINVVFLLLIFFMLAGRLAVSDPFAVEPPVTESAGAVEVSSLTVLLSADGKVALDGSVVARPVLMAAITERLAVEPGAQVVVKADAAAEAAAVIGLLRQIRAAGAADMHLLTRAGGM
tara:strand:+ start:1994 stop:2416 length:423 start_codon:yes stop_codon:yes gene_type:complete